MTETLANGYSSERTQRELSYEYQHDRVWMIFKNLCVLVLWTKVAPALEGLNSVFNISEKMAVFPLSVTLIVCISVLGGLLIILGLIVILCNAVGNSSHPATKIAKPKP